MSETRIAGHDRGPSIRDTSSGERVIPPRRLKRDRRIPCRAIQDTIQALRQGGYKLEAIISASGCDQAIVEKAIAFFRKNGQNNQRKWGYFGRVQHRIGRNRGAVLCAQCGCSTYATTGGLCDLCFLEIEPRIDPSRQRELIAEDKRPCRARDTYAAIAEANAVDAEVSKRLAKDPKPHEAYETLTAWLERPMQTRPFAEIATLGAEVFLGPPYARPESQ